MLFRSDLDRLIVPKDLDLALVQHITKEEDGTQLVPIDQIGRGLERDTVIAPTITAESPGALLMALFPNLTHLTLITRSVCCSEVMIWPILIWFWSPTLVYLDVRFPGRSHDVEDETAAIDNEQIIGMLQQHYQLLLENINGCSRLEHLKLHINTPKGFRAGLAR